MPILPPKFKGKYHIPSNRLKEWDYGTPGYYFVTICTKNMVCWFGFIEGAKMYLSPIGKIVAAELEKTPIIRSNVNLYTWIVMPNHIHAIIIIEEMSMANVETPRWGVSTKKPNWKSGTLGAIINQYKSTCTKRIHELGYANFAWQERYYDHIIRNEKSLLNINAYILGNPLKWAEDEYFTKL